MSAGELGNRRLGSSFLGDAGSLGWAEGRGRGRSQWPAPRACWVGNLALGQWRLECAERASLGRGTTRDSVCSCTEPVLCQDGLELGVFSRLSPYASLSQGEGLWGSGRGWVTCFSQRHSGKWGIESACA